MAKFRYPGPSSFREEDREIFFGRDDDKIRFNNLLALEKLVVLFGKSGSGKTSLLNAAVLPELKKSGKNEVITIRLYPYGQNQDNPVSAWGKVTSAVEKLIGIKSNNIQTGNFIYDKIISPQDIKQQHLWYLLKELQLLNPENPCFLLIFDQFEELFTYPEDQIEEFSKELSDILNAKLPPQQIRNILQDILQDDVNYLTKEESAQLYRPSDIKIVLSIKSESLSLLDRMSNYLPGILYKRYELHPLNEEQAEKAIKEPTSLSGGDFKSDVFVYDKEAFDKIMNFLSKSGKQKIEPFLLQIICHYIEETVINRKLKNVKAGDLGDLEKITKYFYDNILSKIDEINKRDLVRKLIEEDLIFEEDKRRLTLYKGIILTKYGEKTFGKDGISEEMLQYLLDSRILREDGQNYEISHDAFIGPILKSKEERRKKEEIEAIKKRKNKFILTATAYSVIFGMLIVAFYFYQENNRKTHYDQLELSIIKQKNRIKDSTNLARRTEKASKYENYGDFSFARRDFQRAYLYFDSAISVLNEKVTLTNDSDSIILPDNKLIDKRNMAKNQWFQKQINILDSLCRDAGRWRDHINDPVFLINSGKKYQKIVDLGDSCNNLRKNVSELNDQKSILSKKYEMEGDRYNKYATPDHWREAKRNYQIAYDLSPNDLLKLRINTLELKLDSASKR